MLTTVTMRRCDLATNSEKEVSRCQMTEVKNIAIIASSIQLLNILRDADENTMMNMKFLGAGTILFV